MTRQNFPRLDINKPEIVKTKKPTPLLRAQNDYMYDLARKHGGITALSRLLDTHYQTIYGYISCTRVLRPQKAFEIEMRLGEKQVNFWKYMRKYWVPSFSLRKRRAQNAEKTKFEAQAQEYINQESGKINRSK